MRTTLLAFLFLPALLATGCGAGDDEQAEAPANATLTESVRRPLDKADAVEDAVMQQKREIDEALEAAEADDGSPRG